MTIDNANTTQDGRVFLGFLAIVILSTVIGLFSPSSVVTEEHQHPISTRNPIHHVNFLSASPLSGWNRFLSFSVVFLRSKFTNPSPFDCGIIYETRSSQSPAKQVVQSFPQISDLFPGGSARSPEFHLRTDRIIGYEFMDVRVQLDADSAELTGIVLKVVTGTRDHSLLQVCFRVIFSVFSLLFLLFLALRLKSTPFRYWHFEQQLTVVLLALNFLSANLFFPLLIASPTPFRFAASVFFDTLFCAYFWFYIVVVFEFATWRIGKWQPFSVIAPVLLSVWLLVAGLRNWLPDRFFEHSLLPDLARREILQWSQAIPHALFYLLVVVEVLKKYRRPINPHDQYKFNIYQLIDGTAVALLAIEQYVLPWVGIQSDNAVHFLLPFAVRNTFVLLMAYLHWPYEVIRNKADKTNEEDIHADGGFFVSVDDD
jgi:hypothetical protein